VNPCFSEDVPVLTFISFAEEPTDPAASDLSAADGQYLMELKATIQRMIALKFGESLRHCGSLEDPESIAQLAVVQSLKYVPLRDPGFVKFAYTAAKNLSLGEFERAKRRAGDVSLDCTVGDDDRQVAEVIGAPDPVSSAESEEELQYRARCVRDAVASGALGVVELRGLTVMALEAAELRCLFSAAKSVEARTAAVRSALENLDFLGLLNLLGGLKLIEWAAANLPEMAGFRPSSFNYWKGRVVGRVGLTVN